MKSTVAILLPTSLLFFLFGFIAIGKLINPEGFGAHISGIPLIGKGAAALVIATPTAELVFVLLFLFFLSGLGRWHMRAGVFSLFLLYLVGMLLLAPNLQYPCGRVISSEWYWVYVACPG